MINDLKNLLYFPVASYFKFFAKLQLKKWSPRIIVITGSNGKTTLLHLVQSQLGSGVKYSHHANSSYGIPFDILGIKRKNLVLSEWFYIFLSTPFKAFKKPFEEKIYVVEADCDRPGEGKFLSKLLKPDVAIWVSSARTHSMNFDHLLPKPFKAVEDAIAYEYGYFVQNAKKLVIVNGDSRQILDQLVRTSADVRKISIKDLSRFVVNPAGVEFKTKKTTYRISSLLPEKTFYSVESVRLLTEYFDRPFDNTFKNLEVPPGRSSIFKGIKNIRIIDSSYNANLESMTTILNLTASYPGKTKWAVVGDMLEQGDFEQEEHEKLADLVASKKFDRVILMGPRVIKYTLPRLKKLMPEIKIREFLGPKEVLNYLNKNIKGQEVILFKGARFLEGVVENLLEDKKNSAKLCRREKVWQIRREQWGL